MRSHPPSPFPGTVCGVLLGHGMVCAAPLPPSAAARVPRKRLIPPPPLSRWLLAPGWGVVTLYEMGPRGSEIGRAGFSDRAASGGPRGLPSLEAVLSRTHLPLPLSQLRLCELTAV